MDTTRIITTLQNYIDHLERSNERHKINFENEFKRAQRMENAALQFESDLGKVKYEREQMLIEMQELHDLAMVDGQATLPVGAILKITRKFASAPF